MKHERIGFCECQTIFVKTEDTRVFTRRREKTCFLTFELDAKYVDYISLVDRVFYSVVYVYTVSPLRVSVTVVMIDGLYVVIFP